MPTLEQTNSQISNLYWLAFLLTGDREESAEVTANALESSKGNPFFSAWMLAWSRKVVIAKALAAVRHELAASARKIALARSPRRCGSSLPRNWSLTPAASKLELERALLAIDAFPRCVLLLLLFEGLSIDDAMVLLDADRELVRKAQIFALQELTRNLAGAPEAARV